MSAGTSQSIGEGFAYYRFVAFRWAGSSHTDRIKWPGLPGICPQCFQQWKWLNS